MPGFGAYTHTYETRLNERPFWRKPGYCPQESPLGRFAAKADEDYRRNAVGIREARFSKSNVVSGDLAIRRKREAIVGEATTMQNAQDRSDYMYRMTGQRMANVDPHSLLSNTGLQLSGTGEALATGQRAVTVTNFIDPTLQRATTTSESNPQLEATLEKTETLLRDLTDYYNSLEDGFDTADETDEDEDAGFETNDEEDEDDDAGFETNDEEDTGFDSFDEDDVDPATVEIMDSTITGLLEQIDQLRGENAGLTTQLQQQKDDALKEIRRLVTASAKSEASVQSLKAAIGALKAVKDAEATIAATELADANTELADANNQIEELIEDSEEQLRMYEELEQKMARMATESDQAELSRTQIIAQLEQAVQDSKQALDILSKENANLMRAVDDATNLNIQTQEDLTEANAQVEELIKDVSEHVDELEEAKDDTANAKRALKLHVGLLQQAREKFEKFEKRVVDQIRRDKEHKFDLQRQLQNVSQMKTQELDLPLAVPPENEGALQIRENLKGKIRTLPGGASDTCAQRQYGSPALVRQDDRAVGQSFGRVRNLVEQFGNLYNENREFDDLIDENREQYGESGRGSGISLGMLATDTPTSVGQSARFAGSPQTSRATSRFNSGRAVRNFMNATPNQSTSFGQTYTDSPAGVASIFNSNRNPNVK